MRELKFRAWVYYGEKLIKPNYSRDYGSLDRFFEDHSENDTDQCIEQYTGLKDKNGKEIYEGDILELIRLKNATFWDGRPDPLTPPKEVIEYYRVVSSGWSFHAQLCKEVIEYYRVVSSGWSFHAQLCTKYSIEQELLLNEIAQSEIIGNIHENPELLEGNQ